MTFLDSSVVEPTPVKRAVVGSSPTPGAEGIIKIMGNFRYNPREKNKVEYKSFPGIIVGLDYDNQSRPIIEVSFTVNGIEKKLTKVQDRLGFTPVNGGKVWVEFIPTKSGIIINVRERK
jgi:hypothetical protein